MKVSFAHGRSQLPFSSLQVQVTSGGSNSVTRTLYLALQGQNPAGLNLLSDIVGPITINSGQQLTVTVDAADRLDGEWWPDFVISASTSNTPTSFVQLGKVHGFTVGGSLTALPADLVFNSNDKLSLSTTVASPAALPSAPVYGMLRGVTSLNAVFIYDDRSTLTVDNTTVLNGPSGVGRWLLYGATFSTYISNTSESGGCAQSLESLTAAGVSPPKYAANGAAGTSSRFWLLNNASASEARGRRLGISVLLDEEPKTSLFADKIKLKFLGYANASDGTLRTTYSTTAPFPLVDDELSFQPRKSDLTLPDDLLVGEAYVLDAYLLFNQSSLRNAVPNGSVVKINPFFYEEAGEYTEAGKAFGDLIYLDGNLRLAVPGVGLQVRVLDGGGIVNSRSFLDVGQSVVGSLVANTASQIIAINGNGVALLGTLPLDDTEAKRAIVSTVNGTGEPSSWSSTLTITVNQVLSVTCNYPCDSSGFGTIRSNYPDARIAGNQLGNFNPSSLVLYIKKMSSGEIRKFTGLAIVPGTSQQFSAPNWSTGTVIGSVPTPGDASFGFYTPGAVSAVVGVGTSDYTAGGYQASFAFEYANVVTSITHDETQGCLFTTSVATTYAGVATRSQYWAEPVASISALRAVTKATVSPGQHRYVFGVGSYAWEPTSVAVDDGLTSVTPTFITSGAGRWILDRNSGLSLTEVSNAIVVADITALKAINSTDRTAFKPRLVASAATGLPAWYLWLPASTATDDGDTVLRPSDLPSTGRWYKVSGGGGNYIPGGSICPTGCTVGGKAFVFYAAAANLSLTILPGFDISLTTSSSAIQVFRWSQLPNTLLTGKETSPVLTLPQTGGSGVIQITSTFRWISIFARNPRQSSPWDFRRVLFYWE